MGQLQIQQARLVLEIFSQKLSEGTVKLPQLGHYSIMIPRTVQNQARMVVGMWLIMVLVVGIGPRRVRLVTCSMVYQAATALVVEGGGRERWRPTFTSFPPPAMPPRSQGRMGSILVVLVVETVRAATIAEEVEVGIQVELVLIILYKPIWLVAEGEVVVPTTVVPINQIRRG